jgi:hypothetical protein
MKKICDMFTDEEKKQLSYLGSMLQEQQRVLDAWVDARGQEQKKHEEHNGAEKAD